MPNTLSSSLRRKSLLILISFTAVLFSSPFVYSRDTGAPEISPLNDWIYRGAQPREETLVRLKKKGIRTVINFRDEPQQIQWEKARVEALGMKYVSLPWNIMKPVKPELLDGFFKVLDDPRNRPVFFHCKWGRDRSGVMSVLALMRYEKMSEEQARELALETIRPHWRYQHSVNEKIKFFLKARPSEFSQSSSS